MSVIATEVDRVVTERLIAIVRVDSGAGRVGRRAGRRRCELGGRRGRSLDAWGARRPAAIVGARQRGTAPRRRDCTNGKEAEEAVSAGARFLVSPGCDGEIIAWAREAAVLHIAGVMTPTELCEALRAEGQLIKLFPAGGLGSDYVRDLLAPMPEARLVPTEGIIVETANDFLAADAVAVAVGSGLVNRRTVDPGGLASAVERLRPAMDSLPSRRTSDAH